MPLAYLVTFERPLPLRQTLGLVQSLLKLMGLPWAAPDYSTVCRRQKSLDVLVHYRPSSQGLHMLADSTGIKFLGGTVNGARCIWVLMPTLCRSGPSL